MKIIKLWGLKFKFNKERKKASKNGVKLSMIISCINSKISLKLLNKNKK